MVEKSDVITNKYEERLTLIDDNGKPQIKVVEHELCTDAKIPRLGVLLVGLGGNNGTTFTCGVIANKKKLKWATKKGEVSANYYGSFTQCATTKIGMKAREGPDGHLFIEDVYLPIKDLLPMVNPDDIEIGGWDINSYDLYNATKRAQVLEPTLIEQLKDDLLKMIPFTGVFDNSYVAPNQAERADHIKKGTISEQIIQVQEDIKRFKEKKKLDKVVILWTANTEQYYHKNIENLKELESIIERNQTLPPSVVYGVAALKEGCLFINGSPQNTLHSAMRELAEKTGGCIAGSDFKSGQTKYKTAMGEFLIGSGLRCTSVISYNHLGNNDGLNLSDPKTFRSKEISKSSCLDDILKSNPILYPPGKDHIDHTVVIKYCPFVGDSKRAIDEYSSEIFLNGNNTIVSYNICEDSLLAAPIILDLCLMGELLSRISVNGKRLGPVLSYLSFFLKAPVTNHPEYVINNLSRQKETLTSMLKACAGYNYNDATLFSFNF